MSLAGLEKWRPYIDENGVLRPTKAEQRQMLAKAQYDLIPIRVIGGLLLSILISVALIALR